MKVKHKMKSNRMLFLLGLLLLISTCKKDPQNPSGNNKFEYNETTTDSVSYFQAMIKTSIASLGGNEVIKYGHCWSTSENPDLQDSVTTFQGNPPNLSFQSQPKNLLPNTKYYARGYCSLHNTTVFSDVIEFTTKKTGIPVVVTLDVSEITLISAKCDGQVAFDSGLVVSQRGVVWDTVNEFDISQNLGKIIGGIGNGQFSCQINQLIEGNKYYVKAYAVNAAGTAYGEIKSFETIPLQLPQVKTDSISQITTNTAQCGGNVTKSGNGTVSSRGVCWGLDSNPTLENCAGFTTDGSGTGEFSSSIAGLTDGTIYYVRAYAINEKGIGYGNQQSFQTVSINLPTVSTSAVTSITTTSAQSGGNVTSSGNGTVSARGVCFGISAEITLDNCLGFTSNGNGTGSYTSNITGLTPGNTYYVRAYATNQNGTGYGTTQSFNTPDVPSLSTAEVINITANTAQSGGTVTHNGFGTVSGRGICWGLTANPTLGNCVGYTNNGSGMGSFTSNLTGLTASTIYYVRAYATNETGTGYGDLKSFITSPVGLPVVTTADITQITTTTAKSGGEVTESGYGTVTARGICWGLNVNPALGDCIGFTNNGTGTGSFVSNITSLSPGILYYVRAYATNETGTAYGDLKSFTTIAIGSPTVTTITVTNITTISAQSGGNVTNAGNGTVSARGVCWSTSGNPTLGNNLGYTTNGTGIGTFVSNLTGLTPGTPYYVAAYATNEAGTGYGNVESFTTLTITLAIVSTAPVINVTPNSAESGGNVTSNGNGTVSARGVCWSTSQNPTIANSHTTDGSGTGTFTSYLTELEPNTPYYVRAYATNEAGTAYGTQESFTTLPEVTIPAVTTDTVADIAQTTATCGGNVTSDGGEPVTVRGICWSTIPNPTTTDSHTTDGSGTGPFTSYLTELTINTPYYVRAYATNSVGTAYGNEQSFTTLNYANSCPGIPTVTYGGQVYNTVLIGSQCWLKENLNIGTRISGQEQTDNGIIEKYCYNDNEANCNTYGGLYQWNEMMQYTTNSGVQGICPSEWHIPTDGEWSILSTYLDGESVAGGKLKEAGFEHWDPPNTGADNSSGFTALPGGYYSFTSGSYNINEQGIFWTSSKVTNTWIWARQLNYNYANIERPQYAKSQGSSVRCLKNN
jgi:uncharacterized protein (TIGR02145 family)